MRRRLLFLLKAGLSAAFVGVLFSISDPARIVELAARFVDSGWWVAALVPQAGIVLLQAWSWRLLFSVRGDMSWKGGIVGSLIVLFTGTFSPGRLSARVSAPFVFYAVEDGRDLGFSTSVVYLHTATYLAAYGLVASLGLVLLWSTEISASIFLLSIPVGVYLLAGVGLLAGARWVAARTDAGEEAPAFPGPLSSILSGWEEVLRDQARHLKRLTARKKTLLGVLVLSAVSVSILPGLRLYVLLRGAGWSYSPWMLMFLLPALYSVTILPISLGGIGLAEGSAVGVLTLLGMAPSLAVPVVLVDRVLAVYLPALLGWLFFLGLPDGSSPFKTATSSEG